MIVRLVLVIFMIWAVKRGFDYLDSYIFNGRMRRERTRERTNRFDD